jgi:intein-encoded DNA endonuclease-like protein
MSQCTPSTVIIWYQKNENPTQEVETSVCQPRRENWMKKQNGSRHIKYNFEEKINRIKFI